MWFIKNKKKNGSTKENKSVINEQSYKIYKEGEMLDNPLEGPKQFEHGKLDFDRDFENDDFDIN